MENESVDLFGKLAKAAQLLHRFQHQRVNLHGPLGDQHRGQGRVMALLKMQPEISQKELSYLLDIRQQSLGELLVKLERSGWIERAPSETDRRVMQIKLTAEGVLAAESRKEETPMFKSLTLDEQKTLCEYLGRAIGDLEEELEKQSTHGSAERRGCGPLRRAHDCDGGERDSPFHRRHGRHPFPHMGEGERSHRHGHREGEMDSDHRPSHGRRCRSCAPHDHEERGGQDPEDRPAGH